jgi:hypothetical protein
VWSIVVKEKPIVGSPIIWVLTSDRINKVTMDVSARFFIHRFTFNETANFPRAVIRVYHTSEFREVFEATAYY